LTVEAEETTTDVIIPCPGCHSNNTYIRMIKRPKKKKLCPQKKTVRIGYWGDPAEDNKKEVTVQRQLNPSKYLTLMGVPLKKNPIINPPRPEPGTVKVTEGMRKLAQNYADWWKMYNIPFELARLYFQKHPDAWEEMKEYLHEYVLPVRRLLDKQRDSVSDDRWDRSLRDWSDILITAIEKSPRKAREEHHGLKSDGEKILLSINRIKQMKTWLWKHIEDLPKQAPYYITFIDFILQAAKEDPELYEELKRLKQKYDHIRDNLIRSWENNININQNESTIHILNADIPMI
jgi:hypothetical protein